MSDVMLEVKIRDELARRKNKPGAGRPRSTYPPKAGHTIRASDKTWQRLNDLPGRTVDEKLVRMMKLIDRINEASVEGDWISVNVLLEEYAKGIE